MDGIEFAALDTLQHGLPRYAKRLGGLLHHDITFGRFLDKLASQVIGQTNLPRRAGCDLFAGDEALVDPTMQGGGG